MITKHFDRAFVNCVIGEHEITTVVLKEKFDLMCFTCGATLNQIYHKTANQHLTPCLLELCGLNPTVIWKEINVPGTARRLLSTTAMMNLGQTCIRPQIFLTHIDVLTELVQEMKKCVKTLFLS